MFTKLQINRKSYTNQDDRNILGKPSNSLFGFFYASFYEVLNI